jgi:hypothetical protein
MSVGDEFAGRQAQCPGCHNYLLVPTSSQPMERHFEWARPIATENQNPSVETSENPYAASQVTDPSIRASTILNPAEVMQASWTIFKNRWRDIVIGSLLMGLIYFVIAIAIVKQFMIMELLPAELPRTEAEMEKFSSVGVNILFNMLVLVMTSWLMPGYLQFMLKVCRGESTQVSDLFQGYRYYINYLINSVIVYFAVLAGSPILIPAIYFSLMFLPSSYILVDQNKNVTQTLISSMKITQGNIVSSFLIMIAMFVAFLVSIVTFVGPIVVLFYVNVVIAVIYLRMSGQPVSDGVVRERPISNP